MDYRWILVSIMKKLWATYGLTDSGDDLPILLWGHEPSKDEVDARYSAILPDEYSECGGVSWDIQELGEVIP